MQTKKKFFGSLLINFTKILSLKNILFLTDLLEYALNYFKDKVEPNKKFKKPNDKKKRH